VSVAPGSPTDIGPLVAQVEDWVAELFEHWEPPVELDSKVVRDPLHDFVRLQAHEVAVWDTPIVQRLRYIRQNALAYLVYPGLTHTRFEHSIGVMHIADRMVLALATRYPAKVDPLTHVEVRLAALLHDTGHILYSHLGETIMQDALPNLEIDLRRGTYQGSPRYFDEASLGEILSYLIINSKVFEDVFRNKIVPLVPTGDGGAELSKVDLHRVGRMIIGRPAAGDSVWATQIINGSFDADKLDYIMRDSQASGIQTEVDTSRLIHSLRILSGAWDGRLAVAGNATTYLEQIVLAKLTLYTALYHHHKVRATECMARAFFANLPSDGPLPKPATLGGWLRLNEFDVLSAARTMPVELSQFRDILDRRLLKRCLVLDKNTVTEPARGRIETTMILLRNKDEQEAFNSEVIRRLPANQTWNTQSLWIDSPSPPDVDREADQCQVELAAGSVASLSELMPAAGWVRSYVANKLRGHVFYLPDLDGRRLIAVKAQEVLAERPYQLLLNPLARKLALKD